MDTTFPTSLPKFQRVFPDDGACARYSIRRIPLTLFWGFRRGPFRRPMHNFIPGSGYTRRNGRIRRCEIFIIRSEHAFVFLEVFAHTCNPLLWSRHSARSLSASACKANVIFENESQLSVAANVPKEIPRTDSTALLAVVNSLCDASSFATRAVSASFPAPAATASLNSLN